MEKVINNAAGSRKGSVAKRLAKAFISPLTLLFVTLAILLAAIGKAEVYAVMFISIIVIVYGIMRFE